MAIELRTIHSGVPSSPNIVTDKKEGTRVHSLLVFSQVAQRILVTSPFPVSSELKPLKNEVKAPEYEITLNFAYGSYKGCHQGLQPHGFGVMTFNEKDPDKRKEFQGNYKCGKAHGWGKLTWVDGRAYEGNFKNDEITGPGIMKWPDGTYYDGSFLNGKKTGKGKIKFRFDSGDEYEGDYVDGKRTGKGSYRFDNGDSYEGEFVNGRMTGQGTKTCTNGMIFEGKWVNEKWISGKEYYRPKEVDCSVAQQVEELYVTKVNASLA